MENRFVIIETKVVHWTCPHVPPMYHPCTNPHGINYFCNFAFKIGDGFSQSGFLVPLLFAGLAFSFALLTIIFGGVDLFTSNTMYLTMGVLEKKSRVKDLIKVWIATYIGNLIGVLFFTFLFVNTGLFDNIQPDHYLLTSAESKK
ncbi:formate/nitrite transporter family protein [Bacillus sp. P1(2020)]|uniref:Formate/nitrite transporter family protein n=1 Tax=Pallidibacillus pasinlerensis TaxID=2703818 RepID=A0ABX0A2P8_9BACI|nr:formate/nitrite transporter family protein [Pallidibacillus pasinlerensis]